MSFLDSDIDKLVSKVMDITAKNEIENHFSYHSPKGDQPERYEKIRSKAKELAYLIQESCPTSDEKSLAMRKLEECVMWANASIARNEKEEIGDK